MQVVETEVRHRQPLTTPPKPKRRRWWQDPWFWIFWGLSVILAVEVWVLTRTQVISSIITSSSMEPTLKEGDRVLIRLVRYTPERLPRRGEIVFFHDPNDPDRWLIKRVIGLPGEEVIIWQGRVYINRQRLRESYLNGSFYDAGVWRVPQNAVFVMGDNRSHSEDSRDFGPVPLDHLKGRVILRYLPLSRFGVVR